MEQIQKKEKITKEQFIQIWKKTCEDNTMKENKFESGNPNSNGELYHSINIFRSIDYKSKSINLDVLLRFLGKDEETQQGKFSPEAKVIFDNYIEYVTIELEEVEYEEMVNLFVDAQSRAGLRQKNEIVEEREKDLQYFID